jgi:hypothetical protein
VQPICARQSKLIRPQRSNRTAHRAAPGAMLQRDKLSEGFTHLL